MPLPLVPVAGFALKYGTLALAAWQAGRLMRRSVTISRTDQRAEDALDDLPEGFGTHQARDRDQRNVAARLRRRITVLDREWEIDAGMIARIKLKKV